MRAEAGFLGPAEVRRLAVQLGLRPAKRWGQNFVHDANTVRRIVAAARLAHEDTVLEVGPGLGSLTLGLLHAVRAVVAVEIDQVLAAALPDTVVRHVPDVADRLRVITGDALRVSAAGLRPTRLVSNLPYNVAVPVVLHLVAELPTLRGGLVMVQAEVADRLVAPPGSRTYGAPSAKLAWFAQARPAGSVPRSVFWPVPHVGSKLVAFERREQPSHAPRDVVFEIVDAAFSQRRKALRSALAAWAGGADRAASVLAASGVDPTIRGERLDIAGFARIAEVAVAAGIPPGSGGEHTR